MPEINLLYIIFGISIILIISAIIFVTIVIHKNKKHTQNIIDSLKEENTRIKNENTVFQNNIEKILNQTALNQERMFGDVKEKLANVYTTQNEIQNIGANIVDLKKILSDKQKRGAYGEQQLKIIIDNLLPSNQVSYQATLSNGKRADCLINLPNPPGSIVVDAKFPLEAFSALQDAENDKDKIKAIKELDTAVKGHTKAISEKYLIPGETADSALMFVPSEAVFAEIHASCSGAVSDAMNKRVWIVSPGTLAAVLITLKGVLNDLNLAQKGSSIRADIQNIMIDATRLFDRSDKLGKQLETASESYRQLNISLEKIRKRLDQIDQDLEDQN